MAPPGGLEARSSSGPARVEDGKPPCCPPCALPGGPLNALPMTTLVVTPDLEILLRLGLAVLCGLVVGMNRAHHGNTLRPNRLRVHVLVGLSACLLVLASGGDGQARSRAIQGVASGVGFLGAGEILVASRPKQTIPEVHGLTSAASIWFTAALGVTVATSTPIMAGAALLLALITLTDRDHRSEKQGDQTPGTETEKSAENPPETTAQKQKSYK